MTTTCPPAVGRVRRSHPAPVAEPPVHPRHSGSSFSRWIPAYLRTGSRKPSPSRSLEGEVDRFVRWLYDHVPMTPDQEQLLISLRLRQSADYLSLQQDLALIRFQLIWTQQRQLAVEHSSVRSWRILFHPRHVLAEVCSKSEGIKAQLVLYHWEGESRQALIDLEALPWVLQLSQESLTVGDWLEGRTATEQAALLILLGDLHELQLVAFCPESSSRG